MVVESHQKLEYVWCVNYCSCWRKGRQVLSETTRKQGWFWQFSKVAAKLMKNWKKSWKVMEFEKLKRVRTLCKSNYQILNYRCQMSDLQHFHWLVGHRLPVRIPAVPNMVNERVNNKASLKSSLQLWKQTADKSRFRPE